MEQGQGPLYSYMGSSSKIIVSQCRGFFSLSTQIDKMLSKIFLQFMFPTSSTNFKSYSVTSYSTEIRPWLSVDMVCCLKIHALETQSLV